ncbi:septum formation inhibitor Maf [Pseudoalteromonas sp. MEBiC 03607]|jgi:septum formation protein|uniref:Maf family protein n=1 Tax=Pseudoalteromonas TaxID=53246 RepID=UPI000C543BA3|nr:MULTISPECIES: Maf family protein [unclassified Pseudoalteromonas]MBD58042.1 septum formation inhibitor Maf [Pseudoalteromonas sp.]MBU76700.1 septum formation inhibitor Maf [Pseudoalteromonadaceae bacterium]MCF2899659.1 Maf-like protein [Pseudoalteromonas sp. OFAV1]MCF2920701.1 Maf-like protein [Pseudoalteromonas sp. APAL1]MCO7248844.1 Maf-like protein [Pseudoalteromonas sp. Ps84H-4]|tara:strand:+ start:846 stop:1415 length:570 start_codon:yes stop_codon:yes gene_type:complete
MQTAIYLASASPRRKELLSQLGVEFSQFSVDADESQFPNESPRDYVERLARLKAQSGVAMGYTDRPVLGSDTVVVIDDTALVKPVDQADFTATMQRLSGRTHQVMTAVAIANSEQVKSCVVVTDVTFKKLSDEEIDAYWHSGEPQDKAGGYGIQGLGGRFVSHISGSYFAVVGLPLYETEQLLNEFLRG